MIFKLISGRRKIFFSEVIYFISTVAILEPFATHHQWTSLSDLGDQFCLGITFSGEIENLELSENSKVSESKLLAKCVLHCR